MTVRLIALATTEARWAKLLASEQSVMVRAHGADVSALCGAGFVEGPVAVECFVQAPFLRPKLTRRHLNSWRSVKQWQAYGLRLELTSPQAFGVDTFFSRVYYPLFARAMFQRGITPHGAHEVAGMQALLTATSLLALVRREGVIVGAAVLNQGAALGPRDLAFGGPPQQTWYEGLIYVLQENLHNCQRALLIKLADACGERGQTWLSLGQDAPLCEQGYDLVLREKLHIADAVVFRFGSQNQMFSWRAGENERFMFFAGSSAGCAIGVRNYGCTEASYSELLTALRRHVPKLA